MQKRTPLMAKGVEKWLPNWLMRVLRPTTLTCENRSPRKTCMPTIKIADFDGEYAIVQLDATAELPGWWSGPGFGSVSRGDDELSIVCLADRVPGGVSKDGGWTAFKFIGPFAFGETGIVLSVIRPLSENGVGIFLVSTFNGDYLLLKQYDVERSRGLLLEAGHELVSLAPAF